MRVCEVMLLISPENRSGQTVGSLPEIPWTEEEVERAAARLTILGPTDCWPCKGSRFPEGYGRFFARSRDYQLHRVILEIKLRRHLGPDERARHTCDNPPCGNPTHLVPGSARDNNRDAIARGRNAKQLTDEQIEAIRSEAAQLGWGGRAALGKKYGVSGQHIGRIVRLRARVLGVIGEARP